MASHVVCTLCILIGSIISIVVPSSAIALDTDSSGIYIETATKGKDKGRKVYYTVING